MTENEALEMIKRMTIHPNCEMLKAFEFQSIVIKALEDLEQYRAIGTIEEFKALKEKNKPEKPLFVPTDDTCLYQEYRCPSCNEWLADKFKPYRCKCGQKLDWQ